MAIDLNDTLQMMQVIDRAKAPASFLLDTSELQARDFREFVEGEEIPVVLYEDDNKIHDGGSARNYDGLSSDNVSLAIKRENMKEKLPVNGQNFHLDKKLYKVKTVNVYLQSIPDEEWLSDSYYPLVVPRVKAVTDNGDGKSEVEIEITVGVHGEGADTWRDLLSVMERIRQRFCNNKIIGNKYHLQFPIKWETADPQPYPYWIGYGDIKLVVGQPRRSYQELEEMEWAKKK